jgi:hypothetical protein
MAERATAIWDLASGDKSSASESGLKDCSFFKSQPKNKNWYAAIFPAQTFPAQSFKISFDFSGFILLNNQFLALFSLFLSTMHFCALIGPKMSD